MRSALNDLELLLAVVFTLLHLHAGLPDLDILLSAISYNKLLIEVKRFKLGALKNKLSKGYVGVDV